MLDKKKKKEDSFEKNTVSENKFTDLRDLVKAPLLAVAGSNIDLSKSIVNYIQATGKEASVYNEKVVFLENINLGYQQIKQTDDNLNMIEDMALQVPLLSIMPISSLHVKKAKIDFNAEVRGIEKQDHSIQYEARVCAPESRSTDYLSKMHFEIEVESLEATEGLSRFIDVLNMHQIPKKIDSRIVKSSGNVISREMEKSYLEKQKSNDELRQIQQAIEKTESIIQQQKLTFDGLLKSTDEFKESNYDSFVSHQTTREIKKMINPQNSDKLLEIMSLYQDIQTNNDGLSNLIQKRQSLQQALLQSETEKVLSDEK